MLSIASEQNVDLQVFLGLLIQSDEIKTDVTDIINRVNQRGVSAVLDKKDIKLFKRLFEDMEGVFDHMKGLNPSDPIFDMTWRATSRQRQNPAHSSTTTVSAGLRRYRMQAGQSSDNIPMTA